MEYIKQLLTINKLNDLSIARQEQLKIESNNDTILKQMNLPCDRTVNNYLFILRENNRQRTQKLIDASMIDYIDVGFRNLDLLREENDKIKNILESGDRHSICEKLEQSVREHNRQIRDREDNLIRLQNAKINF